MSWQLLLALAASAFCGAFGQIMLKLGATGRQSFLEFLNIQVLAGLSLYGIGTAIWIFALSRLPLSVVYPFSIVTLGLVLMLSFVMLGERPSATVIAGLAIVVVGIGLVAAGSQS